MSDPPETPDPGKAPDSADAPAEGESDVERARRERGKAELGDWRQRAAVNLRVPRKPFFARREIMLVFMLLIALLAIVALKKPCAQGVSHMMQNFDEPDGGPALRKPTP